MLLSWYVVLMVLAAFFLWVQYGDDDLYEKHVKIWKQITYAIRVAFDLFMHGFFIYLLAYFY